MIALAWLGCRHPAPPSELPPLPPPGAAQPAVRTPVVGPTYWSEPGGLCLEVPAGWAGSTGEPPLLLQLSRADGGYGLEIWAYPGADRLPDREGFDLLFQDPGAYRTVPLLAPSAGTRSWVSTTPGGPMAQSWYGVLGGRTVEVVAIYPPNGAIQGEQVVKPVLDAICSTWR